MKSVIASTTKNKLFAPNGIFLTKNPIILIASGL